MRETAFAECLRSLREIGGGGGGGGGFESKLIGYWPQIIT